MTEQDYETMNIMLRNYYSKIYDLTNDETMSLFRSNGSYFAEVVAEFIIFNEIHNILRSV